ncbi:RNA 2',3'-cyclic phosphodiesterase [Lentibacillus salinarum]|uniref:RNA 2',3'-cyclic phosphodiesterase n=1 Tax=Lentibacillus salinarum TaxID=446820 RepID=A0ABW3ZVN6_9BACI
MNLPHYFLAVPLPGFLKEQYARWQRSLKEKLPYRQWTHPDDLHITLTFLGAVSQEQVKPLHHSLQAIEKIRIFTLQTEALGTFGDPAKPRVLWAGVKRNDDLLGLQRTVEHIALQAGFQQEKRTYSPHITLAKKWDGGKQDLSALKQHYTEGQSITVNEVVLYRIDPAKSPKYYTAAAYHLMEEGT